MGFRCFVWFLLWTVTGLANAYQPDFENTLPEPLQPWRDWVLQEQPNHPCPFKSGQFAERHCLWPAHISLSARADSARFQMFAHSYSPGWLVLPGGEGFWPRSVTVNQKAAELTEVGGRPALYLPAGQHSIDGSIHWQRIPDNLLIPENTGLVTLKVNGKPVAMPRREAGGRLWLVEQRSVKQATSTEDKLGLSVFRHLQDGAPFEMVTEVQLEVSGRPREALLGVVRLPGFELSGVDSPLPVRVEDDGRLRIRLRPGSWTLQVRSLQNAGVESLPLPEIEAIWPSEELWSFEPRSSFRQVRIEGAESVDPGQTRIPEKWKRWKAFRLVPGQVLKLVTIRRGDPEPAPNRLQLNRTAWLAFAGDNLTFQDQISGTLSRDWRLNVIPGFELGHVSSGGEPLVVTEHEGSLGVELRQSPVSLQAVGKLTGDIPRRLELAASGWQQDFEQLSLNLHMPPGWRLLAASGADRVNNAWLNSWQVWDVFLLLITVAALAKLRGVVLALVSGVAFFLIYPEAPGILWLWLNMMAILALLSVLKPGGFQRLCVLYGRLSALALVAVCLPFLVSQARTAIYPQLELGYHATAASGYHAPDMAAFSYQESDQMAVGQMADTALEATAVPRDMPRRLMSKVKPREQAAKLVTIDPNTAAQTGPSVPTWHWNRASLNWSGPVTQGQSLTLYFLKPLDTRIAAVLRVLLLVVIAVGLFRGWRRSGLGFEAGTGTATATTSAASLAAGVPVAVWLALMNAPDALAATAPAPDVPPATVTAQAERAAPDSAGNGFPSQFLLQQLKQRLLSAGDCSPHCVAANRALLRLVDGRLELQIEYHALEKVQVPLPHGASQWVPDSVTIDALPAPLRRENNTLWAALEPGTWRLQISGPVQAGESLQLSFPEPVYNLTVVAPGWKVRGMDNGRISGGALYLDPVQAQQRNEDDADRLPPNVINPFVRVERHLRLGLNWYVETRVVRMAPQHGAIKLQIPLLPGESVTTQNVAVKQGMVDVVLSSQQAAFTWYSALDKTGEIHLKAAEGQPWVEQWQLEVAALWHVEADGIAPVKAPREEHVWEPRWQPLPGDELSLRIVKPAAAQGATTTIDRASLQIEPGRQDTSYALNLSLRSSKGTEQRIRLHEQARILGVTLDGKAQPSQEQGTHLVVPINPGEHQLAIRWREPTADSLRQTGPELQIDGVLANLETTVDVPRSRWVMLVGGPRMGPAVLVWGELLVVILIAFALARIPGLPLKTYEWILLAMGLCAGFLEAGILVVLWFVALRKRQQIGQELSARWFNLYQVLLVLLTFIALIVMVGVIPMGLMDNPDMGIVGNGSSHYHLRWYLDQSDGNFPDIWWVSLPLWCYRLLMLLWSLWLAVAILRWLRWAWQCFSEGGLWRKRAPAASGGQKSESQQTQNQQSKDPQSKDQQSKDQHQSDKDNRSETEPDNGS